MPRLKMTLSRLLICMQESFPSGDHVPTDELTLSMSHEDSRELHARLLELLDKEEQLKVLTGIVDRSNPILFNALCSAIVEMQTRYSPGGEMGDQCDPDNPNSRHWKNWMTGVVVFRAKEEKDFLGYIDRYNKIMEKRRADRKEADKERRAQNKAR